MGVKGGCKGFSMFRQHEERAHNSGGSYIFGWFRRSFRSGRLPTCLPVVCSAGNSRCVLQRAAVLFRKKFELAAITANTLAADAWASITFTWLKCKKLLF